MKVELEKLKMGHSQLTDNIFVGTIIKEGVWRNKFNMTNEFLFCVIARFEGKTESIIGENGEEWEVTVKKIK